MTIARSCAAFLAATLVVMALLATATAASTQRLFFVGTDIPDRIQVPSRFIFTDSDSLTLNSRLLVRDVDYVFESGSFDLRGVEFRDSDTLRVVFSPLPTGTPTRFGRQIPQIAASENEPQPHETARPKLVPQGARSDITLSGAKTFRFSARSSGASEFSQSFDLDVEGELARGLTLTGSISDRGYNPSYGVANSRVSELDKVSLKLTSRSFVAQVGDFMIQTPASLGLRRGKRLSGASARLGGESWAVNAVAGRPEGRFATARFQGQDGRQGPYQISADGGARPISPGSETVWLDGRRLVRGGAADYTMDYPAGRVTFSVDHPIDARSRIEVDYEPLADNYRGELYGGGGEVALLDSTISLAMEWLREGDDRRRPQFGELSAADEALLAAAGDDPGLAVRSGVTFDTTGAYELVTDSLPDSVYVFVGEGNGSYDVAFGYIGAGAGAYRFLGSGWYEFVGSGSGDYLPRVALTLPERIDHYQARLGFRSAVLGDLSLGFGHSSRDRNLFSGIDDSDNDGSLWNVRGRRRWGEGERDDSVSVSVRHRQTHYAAQDRINAADFRRKFMTPDDSLASRGDETAYQLAGALQLHPRLTVSSELARLEYKDAFSSNRAHVGSRVLLGERTFLRLGWSGARSDLDTVAVAADGRADNVNGLLQLAVGRLWQVGFEGEYDRRRHDFSGDPRGTRYARVMGTISSRSEQIALERYTEDTLLTSWTQTLRRTRLSASSDRRIGKLKYRTSLAHQWLERTDANERNSLGQLSYRYRGRSGRVNVSGAYTVSTETRNARGVAYIEVERGQGDYILEDGAYVPDPDGDYLRVEEILSDQARVRRGEKSFHFAREWSEILVRFNSAVEEELKDEGDRGVLWIVPFLTDSDQPYLFYSRRYDADLRLGATGGFHIVNLTGREAVQIREVAGDSRERRDIEGRLVLKQAPGAFFLEQSLRLFKTDRNEYYSGAGEVEGLQVGATARRPFGRSEVTVGASWRRAESAIDERSDISSLRLTSRTQSVGKAELRSSLELYSQRLSGVAGVPSYTLTDNRPGERGAIWSVGLRYGTGGQTRVNLTITGRHADTRTARITGRGEFVAGF